MPARKTKSTTKNATTTSAAAATAPQKPTAPTVAELVANDAARAAALNKLRDQPGADGAKKKTDPAKKAKASVTAATETKPLPAARRTAKAEPRTGGLTAAHEMLLKVKEPMRVRELTKLVIDKGLWSPAGKTPWSTLAAAIGREIKDKGKLSRFKKTDRGLFAAVTPR